MSRLACVLLVLIGCASAGDGDVVPVDAPPGGNPDGPPEIPDGPPNSACDNKLGTYATGFENATAGWSHVVMDGAEGEADWPFDEWNIGTATTVGPTMCHEGTKCAATHLTKNYTSCSRAALISPTFDLSQCTGRDVKLSFWSWHSFWTGSYNGTTWYDGGVVEISTNGTAWTPVTPTPAYPGTLDINPRMGSFYECVLPTSFYADGKQGFVGNGNGWKLVTISIPAAMLTSSFQVRFAYASGVSNQSDNPETNRNFTAPGWYIDELAFSAL
ncbi:MAG TPA: hypothetical protein VIU61_10395 [Kofleriaceae bacterium]